MADFTGDPTQPWVVPEWDNLLAEYGYGAPSIPDPLAISAGEYGTLAGAPGIPNVPGQVPIPIAPPVASPMTMPVSSPTANGYAPLTPFVPAPAAPVAPHAALAGPAGPAPDLTVSGALASIAQSPVTIDPNAPPAITPHWDVGALAGEYAPLAGYDTHGIPPVNDPGFLPPGQDPWANTQPDVAGALGGIAQPVQPGTDAAIAQHEGERLANDPVALIESDRRIANDRRNKMADDMIAASQQARTQLEQDHAARVAARAKTQAQMDQLQADTKALADGGYGWNKMSTGTKLLSLFAAFAGGLHASLKMNNGQNIGAQMVQKNIEEDLQARQQGLATRRALLGEQAQSDEAKAHEMEAYRQASYETALRGMQAEWTKYDPAGSAANNIAHEMAAVKQLQTQSLLQYQGVLDKHNETSAKIELDMANAMKARAEAGKTAAKGTGGGGGSYSYAQVAAMVPPGPWMPPSDPKNPNQTFSRKEVDQILETAKKSQDVAGGGPVGAETRHLSQVATIPGVTEIDEKGAPAPFIAKGTDAELAKLRDRVSGTYQIAHILDEAMKVRTGWSSDTGNSDEHQQLEALMGQAKFAIKNQQTLGQITESDLKLIEGGLGTADFTKYRDFAAGVAQARKTMIGTLRDDMVSHGLSKRAAGKFDIVNSYDGNDHVNTTRQDAIKKRIHDQTYRTTSPPTTDDERKKVAADAANDMHTVDEISAYRVYVKSHNPRITDAELNAAVDLYSRQPAFR